MKIKTITIVAVALLIASIILAIPVQAETKANAPSYSVGDYWEMKTGGDYPMEMKTEVKKTGVTVEGHKCVEEKTTVSVDTGMGVIETTSTHWARASDLASVKQESKSSMMGIESEVTMVYDPPQTGMKFPMYVGLKWTAETTVRTTTKTTIFGNTTTTYSNSTSKTNYEVMAEEKVTIPAGTFDCFKIKATPEGGSASYSWYSWKVGGIVKMEAGGSTYELQKYQCKSPGGLAGGGGGGGDDTGGILGDSMMMILIVVVIVIIVVVVLALVVMKKKKAAAAPPPGQPGMAPAPGQPGAVPTTEQPPQQQYDPYGQQQPQQQDPYAQQQPPQQQYDPYGQQQPQQQDPYAQQQPQQQDPYAQQQPPQQQQQQPPQY
jgi:hypothetical protein